MIAGTREAGARRNGLSAQLILFPPGPSVPGTSNRSPGHRRRTRRLAANPEARRALGFALGGSSRPTEDTVPAQRFFKYIYPGAEIVTYVSPMLRARLCAPVQGFFGASTALDKASTRLMSQDLLYVGNHPAEAAL